MIVQPGPVVDFLIANQNARDPFSLDWAKVINVMHIIIIIIIIIIYKFCCLFLIYFLFYQQAKKMLKNLRVKTSPSNTEYKITGLSEKPCKEQLYGSYHVTICIFLLALKNRLTCL